MRGLFRASVVVGTFAMLAWGSPAEAQSADSPITGYGACRVSIRITRPFPIADGVVQKDLERLVHYWNMNSKVPSMDGRCAVGSLAEIQEYVTKWSTELGLEIVDFEPDWQVITFNRIGGGAQAKASVEPSKAETLTTAETQKNSPSGKPAADELRKKALEAHAAVEERNRERQAKYEAELAEQKRKVDEFERAKQEMARKQEEQRAAAERALAAHNAQLVAHAETVRQHDAEVAKYEQEVAAQKYRKDFDERHKLGQASTDTDANQCVTTPETQLNASFQGNTAASVMNGCGQPVDVMICLMTDTGWTCGATYGLASQQRWSFSAFKATGQVFADARTSGSNRPLAKPN